MTISHAALRDKITLMYPEVTEHGIVVSVDFDAGKDAYIITFKKDRHELSTHLEKKDAEDCMKNIKCVYLGVQVGQFVKNFASQS